MKMEALSFVLSVSPSAAAKAAGGSVDVRVNLSESDVPAEVLAAALTSGQSPRVRLQGSLREDGIPKDKTLNLTWAEFIGTSRLRIAIPMTKESIFAELAKDSALAKAVEEWMRAKAAE